MFDTGEEDGEDVTMFGGIDSGVPANAEKEKVNVNSGDIGSKCKGKSHYYQQPQRSQT